MKIKTILTLALAAISSSASAGVALSGINKGVLANSPEVRFQGGTATVRMINGDFFKMQGFGDRVEFQSVSTKDWYFDNKVIYPQELPLANINNIEADDILTIIGTALHDGGQPYNIGVIKYYKNGRLMLRVVSAAAIPEPAVVALGMGLVAFAAVAIRRRKVAQ